MRFNTDGSHAHFPVKEVKILVEDSKSKHGESNQCGKSKQGDKQFGFNPQLFPPDQA